MSKTFMSLLIATNNETLSDVSDLAFNMEFQSLVEKFVNSTSRYCFLKLGIIKQNPVLYLPISDSITYHVTCMQCVRQCVRFNSYLIMRYVCMESWKHQFHPRRLQR